VCAHLVVLLSGGPEQEKEKKEEREERGERRRGDWRTKHVMSGFPPSLLTTTTKTDRERERERLQQCRRRNNVYLLARAGRKRGGEYRPPAARERKREDREGEEWRWRKGEHETRPSLETALRVHGNECSPTTLAGASSPRGEKMPVSLSLSLSLDRERTCVCALVEIPARGGSSRQCLFEKLTRLRLWMSLSVNPFSIKSNRISLPLSFFLSQ